METGAELILIAAAVIPAVWLMVRVYKADRIEKEPIGLLIGLMIAGILSTSLAGLLEQVGRDVILSVFGSGGFLTNLIYFFFVVAVAEEGSKYLLLKWRTWKNPNFNCTFDGIVYSVFVSLGFALWENIAYVLQFGLGTAVVRAVTAVPGHACFGVFMGFWYGIAKRRELSGNPEESKHARANGLITAILLHGIYDFIATGGNELMSILFLIFVGWMFTRASNLVKQASAEDSPL